TTGGLKTFMPPSTRRKRAGKAPRIRPAQRRLCEKSVAIGCMQRASMVIEIACRLSFCSVSKVGPLVEGKPLAVGAKAHEITSTFRRDAGAHGSCPAIAMFCLHR